MNNTTMHPTPFYLVAVSLTLFFASQRTGLSAPSEQAFWLTQNSVAAVELSTSRIVARQPVQAGATRKIVSSGRYVFLHGKRTIQVLRAQTLEPAHTVNFTAEVHDIAASDSLLVVASGSKIHIVRISGAGQGTILKSLQVPKAAHSLAASGTSVYAIDNVGAPFYSHFIDLRDQMAPRLTTMEWAAVNGSLVSQAIADRWYVRETYKRNIVQWGSRMWALSPKPPIERLERWDVALGDEFRVHGETLYWVDAGGEDRVWLIRRLLRPSQAATEKLIPLGPLAEWWAERWAGRTRGTIELVGSRLYVAVGRQFLAFDVHPSRPPVRVIQISSPSPIISFALQVPGR